MGRVIEMKMAKPKAGEFEAVVGFMQLLESIIEQREVPGGDGEPTPVEFDEDALAAIEKAWEKVSACYCRVLFAGQTAIENACDPDADALEFKPEIKEAVAKAEQFPVLEEQLKVACRRAESFKAALEMIAAVRHVSGSAQGVMRSHLMIADAALEGADFTDPETAIKVAEGKWRKP
jgi:hypothetical protein